MKKNIILAGVGGQGILSIAAVIGQAALKNNLQVKQAETHGMSQRGGDVVSHLRISDVTIYSDLIAKGTADLIIALEPMEALRYLPYLSKTGYIVTSIEPVKNISNYPDENQILGKLRQTQRLIAIDVNKTIAVLNNKQAGNMVVLGAASSFLKPITFEALCNGIGELFGRKGEEVVAKNIEALSAGKSIAENVKF
jgi:indolepyruvate ferredoxin oxidoreductase, beta subunit